MNPIWVLIIVTFVVFIARLVRPELVLTFGLRPISFLQRPWTLVTSMFVHADFGHIIGNMFTLYFFGSFLMSLVGETAFLVTYFVGGIVGSLVYLLLPSSLFAPMIGASGAIFAVGGALAVLRPKQTVYVFPIPAPIPLWVAVIGGFVIVSLLPSVAWQAHFGGLVYGLATGYFFRRRERRRVRW
ncbi:MAG: rhomboid family intramembrane serine protease [Dehalococcoidia bacterium]|nr:rhomboid family intramembrane serine protease [Dehalococcoidia bacterium]